MKRTTRNIIIVAACAAALGTAVVVLQRTGSTDTASSAASSSAQVTLISKQSSDVVSMKVTNKSGSYTIIPVTTSNLASTASSSADSSSTASVTTTTTYTIQELNGCPVDTDQASTVMQDGFSLTATKSIGTVSSLSDYGLADPQATVEVAFKDGSTFSYKIGNATATSEYSYYMCGDKTDNVYVVSVNAGLLQPATYFLKKDMLAVQSDSSSTTTTGSSSANYDFTRIVLSGTAYPKGVTMEMKDKVLTIVSPDEYDIDSTNLQSLETPLTTLTGDSVVAYNPDAAALAKYGLDKPTAVAEYTVNKESHKLTIGAKDGTEYYAMVDDKNLVYTVSADTVAGLATQSLYALRSKLIYLPNIKTVKAITATIDGKDTRMEVTRTEKASSSSAASSTSSGTDEKEYDYKVTVNGKELDYDKNFRYMYETIISIALYGDTETMPSGTPSLTLKYEYFDSSNTDLITFYPTSDRRYTALKNGKLYGECTPTTIEAAITAVKDFIAGKDLSSPF